MSQTKTRRSPASRAMPRPAESPRRATARLAELPPTLTIDEAGEMLGISRRSAYRAAARGEIPTLRLGRRLLVPTPRLLTLLGLAIDEPADDPSESAASRVPTETERPTPSAARPLRPPADRSTPR